MAISKKTQKKLVRLYENDKLSCAQIAKKLNISISGACYWLKKNKIKKRSISEAILQVYSTKFDKKPFRIKEKYFKNDSLLKVAGTMLYWGEGAKNGGCVKFTNSDPQMVKLFLKFLRVICGIAEERLKALIHMYPDHDENNLIEFWSATTNIPASRFYKSCIHKGKVGTYKNKSKYGTLAISYSDKRLLNVLLDWIEKFKKQLM